MFVIVVCCLNVHIFVPRLILNFDMFYKTVKCIRIEYLKSRQNFASWVLVPLKMANMAFCLFFDTLGQLQIVVWGVYMHQIILLLEFRYFGLWRTHLQNYTFLGHLRSTGTLTSQSFLFIFNVNYEQKWHLKVCVDARAICSTGFLFSPAYAIWYLDTKTPNILMYTKPLQKKHVPLKLGQLWLCQTFYFAFVCCRLSLFVCKHFCALNNFKF